MEFFSLRENKDILIGFMQRTTNLIGSELETRVDKRLFFVRSIIELILEDEDKWDQRCQFNIQHIGEQIIRRISRYTTGQIDELYASMFRLFTEFEFNSPNRDTLYDSFELRQMVLSDNDEMEAGAKFQIAYASAQMAAEIIRHFLTEPNTQAFIDYSKKVEEAQALIEKKNKLINDVTTKIEKKEAHLNAISNKLDEYTTTFNFVGLHEGFTSLVNKKKAEGTRLFYGLLVTAFIILLPIAISFFKFDTSTEIVLKNYIPLFLATMSLELILIYFFRILLSNHKSVQTQIAQIELRQTLCQFVQSYAEYASSIRKSDPTVLDKFESLIFSSIVSNSDKIPSTFDGLDQIGNLVKSMKK